MTSVNQCVNCRWASEDKPQYLKCNAPANVNSDEFIYVGGFSASETPRRWTFCATQRTGGWLDTRMFRKCGREGRWFESKDISS